MFDWKLFIAIMWGVGAFWTFISVGLEMLIGRIFIGWRPWQAILAYIGLMILGVLPWIALLGYFAFMGIRWVVRNEPL
jgi:hypothetical protein